MPDDLRRAVDRERVLAQVAAVEGWLSAAEAGALIDAATTAAEAHRGQGAAFIEVGSYCGKSTIAIAAALLAAGTGDELLAIDPHRGRVSTYGGDRVISEMDTPPTLERFRRNVAAAGVAAAVREVVARSVDVEPPPAVAFLFIDGLHDVISVAADFRHFARNLTPGGLVAFHDYANPWGVKPFVDALLARGEMVRCGGVGTLIILARGRAPGE